MSASVSAMRGGQPSTTQPIAAPWLSPKLVNRNICPKVLNDMGLGTPQPCGGQILLNRAVNSRISRHPVALKHVNDALRDIDQGRRCGLGDAEISHQPAGGATMGGRHGVVFQARIPAAHPLGNVLVALPARRHEIPLVVLALGDAGGESYKHVSERMGRW